MKTRFELMIMGLLLVFGAMFTVSAGVSFIWYLVAEDREYGELYGHSIIGYLIIVGCIRMVEDALKAANETADEQGFK